MRSKAYRQSGNEMVIRRLRLKIIAITMGALLAVIIAMLAVLNVFMQRTSRMQSHFFLQNLIENHDAFEGFTQGHAGELEGMYAGPMSQMLRDTRFFAATLDEHGAIIPDSLMLFGLDHDEAIAYIDRIVASERTEGMIDAMQYIFVSTDSGYDVAFVEQKVQNLLLFNLQRISILVACASGALLLILTVFLAVWITKPIRQSLEKQKAFISDASHEMKTPLTIIATNAEVLAQKQGESKWLATIQSQTLKLSALVHDMLLLAKSSESKPVMIWETVNFSEVATNVALSFESPMFEAEKAFTMDIEGDIYLSGNATNLEQLINILLDNALQYSDERGSIHISLKRHGGRAQLSVFNTGTGLPRGEMTKVFRRFYRGDTSRSRQAGGYGLGLSIAQAIVQQHKGIISVAGEEGKDITFYALLRMK